MTDSSIFRCIIIGETSLSTRCAQVVRSAGHELAGIISPNSEVREWAKKNAIVACESAKFGDESLCSKPFDYLFSIVNNLVLSPALLALPRRGAINFHDGPLPRYAGIHSTSWALMHQERQHGVSWHAMVDQVDAGPIYEQERVEVSEQDTAFSLNIKCYEAGVRAFSRLVTRLGEGSANPTDQDLSRRTYFGLHQRPESAAVLDWQRPTAELHALIRALEFGPTANPLGRAKVALGDTFVLCPEATRSQTETAAPPGTVTALDASQLCVATGDGAVAISRLLTLAGSPLAIDEAKQRFGLLVGAPLPLLSEERRKQLTALNTRVARHEVFWVRRLLDLRAPNLPYLAATCTDHGATSRLAGIELRVPDAIYAELEGQAAPSQGFDRLAAALALYLWRLCGNEPFDLAVRLPALTEEIAGLEALFATSVPLRVQVDESRSAGEAWASLRADIEALGKRDTYLLDLPARYPALAGHRQADASGRLPAGALWLRSDEDVAAPAEGLALCLCFRSDGRAELLYREGALSSADAQGIAEQFSTFLVGLTTDSQQRLAQLPLLTAEQSHRLLVEWNATAESFPGDLLLHHYIQEQAATTPSLSALRFGDTELSYYQLDRSANALAHELRNAGLEPGQLAGLCMERSLEMVVALLAVLKAGAGYVPIDPAYPADRISFMLQDTRVPVVLTQRHLESKLPPSGARVLVLDSNSCASHADAAPELNLSPDQIAYVIYTSGSTGKPKGVMISHRAICNRLLWMQQQYSLGQDDRVLQKTPYSFDVSVWEFFWPLMTGACLTLARPGGHQDAAYLVDLIGREGITTLHFVPSMLQLFIEQPGIEECVSLKRVLCSGEALPYELQQRFFERSAAELHNLYGPTEAAVDVTYWACRREDSRRIVPIGRPVANTQTYILDKHGHPTPVGVPGELHLGGVQLALGYLNRPELTAERFVPDPFASTPHARLYRTGDLCRYLPDGAIDFLGRLDFQVKIRGFRIELGEIELALAQHPEIREAVVVARVDEHETTRTYLAAYLVAESSSTPTASSLRAHLAQTLPEFMVPATFVFLNHFPLNSNGKLDRKALPVPTLNPTASGEQVKPATEMERQLAEIFRDALRLEEVGVTDNFFDVGGDSIRAVRITDAIRASLSPQLELVQFFDHPTIRSLAAHLGGESRARSSSNVEARAARQREAAAQRRRSTRNPRR